LRGTKAVNHGLTMQQLNIIKNILKPYASMIDEVALFGSRATGNYQPYSDIDLVIFGQCDETIEARLWTLFYESRLPYKVDVKIYEHVRHSELKKHIDQSHQLLWKKEALLS